MPHLRSSTFLLPTFRQLRQHPQLRLRPSFFLSRPYSYPKEGVFQPEPPAPSQRNIPGFGAPPPQFPDSATHPQSTSEANAYFPPSGHHVGHPSSQQPQPQYSAYPPQPDYAYNEPGPSFWRIKWYNALGFLILTLTFSLGTALTLAATIPLEPGSDLDKEELAALFEELDSFALVQQLRGATQADPNSPTSSSSSFPGGNRDGAAQAQAEQVPAFQEWTAYTALPPARRAERLTTGPLAGSAGLAAQKVFINDIDHSAYIFVNFGPGTCGWPDVVHGGAISTVFDEALGRIAIRDTEKKTGVTAKLEVDFLEGVRSGEWYVVVVKLVPEEMREGFKKLLAMPLEKKGGVKDVGQLLGGTAKPDAGSQSLLGRDAGAGDGPGDGSEGLTEEEKTKRQQDMERKKYVTGIMACCSEVAPRLEEVPPAMGGSTQGVEIALTDVHPHAIAKGLFVVPKNAKTGVVPDGF